MTVFSAPRTRAYSGFQLAGGRESRPERPSLRDQTGRYSRLEGRRAELGFLGRGQPTPSPPARESGGAL